MTKKFNIVYNDIISQGLFDSKKTKIKKVITLIKQFVQEADFSFINGDLSKFGKVQGKFFIKITLEGEQNKRKLLIQLFKKDKKTAIKGFTPQTIEISHSTKLDELIQMVNDVLAPAGIDLTDTNQDDEQQNDEQQNDEQKQKNSDKHLSKYFKTILNTTDIDSAIMMTIKYVALSLDVSTSELKTNKNIMRLVNELKK